MMTLIFYILSFILGTIGNIMYFIAKDFSIWPSPLLDGLTYFFTKLMNLDFIIPIGGSLGLLAAILFMIRFDVAYIGVKILLKIFNWIRGAGGIDI